MNGGCSCTVWNRHLALTRTGVIQQYRPNCVHCPGSNGPPSGHASCCVRSMVASESGLSVSGVQSVMDHCRQAPPADTASLPDAFTVLLNFL